MLIYEGDPMSKLKVGFICVHNSCRSQMAEALSKHFASDVFEAYSAGIETKDRINQDAVRLIKSRYDIDMEQTQSSKLIGILPPLDIVITMGCNVECPYLPNRFREDWGLDDPSGGPIADFRVTRDAIKQKVEELKARIEAGEFDEK